MFRCLALAVIVASLTVAAPVVAEDGGVFPFVVSYDAAKSIADVSSWLACPAGGQGFVHAKEGHLATDAGPIRFWATNVCFDGCFPSHEKADRLAARLARLGINCVRLHHMDNHSIWGKSPNKLTIDPERLERLDYLVAALKRHGVYVDINLHVSRSFGEPEGFVARETRPNYDKGLDNFEPRMIELQKKYARDLLTHVNPYTGTAYAAEPAVAFVEINNENALFDQWAGGAVDRLPEPYAATFRKIWNAWLRKKYGTTDKLRQTWNVGRQALGDEMLHNGDFSQPLDKDWHLERDAETVVRWSAERETAQAKPVLRIVVGRRGNVSWHPQFSQAGFAVKKNTPYTLRFRVRSPDSQRLSVNCMMGHDPWEPLGFSVQTEVESQWQERSFSFLVTSDDDNARLTFTDLGPGTYEIADVTLRPGGIVGVEPDQKLEDDSVPVLRHRQQNLTETARRDFIDFLWDTEHDYWNGMYRFLKDELHVRSIIGGTQLGYSPVHIQAGLDYCDAHSYWHHPTFPGRPWDSRDWYVHNAALVNTPGGTLAGLASRRVAGMAYTVSEYNHPLPIAYAAEGFPMIAAFAGFQAWDGVFSFAYSHNDDFESRRLGGFFDIKSDPARVVHSPACAALFVRGDVAPARQTLPAPLSLETERAQLNQTRTPWSLTSERGGVEPRQSLLHGVALDLTGVGQAAKIAPLPKDVAEYVSDTNQIRWNVAMPGAGYFQVDTPRSKLFTGFVRGRSFRLGDVTLTIGKTRLDWATISMVVVDGNGFDRPGRILVAATGWEQNQDAKLEQLEGDRVTLRDHWGKDPVLCEGIPARIGLPVAADRVRVYPLDESGVRREAIAAGVRDGRAIVTIGPEHKTLWYEIEIK